MPVVYFSYQFPDITIYMLIHISKTYFRVRTALKCGWYLDQHCLVPSGTKPLPERNFPGVTICNMNVKITFQTYCISTGPMLEAARDKLSHFGFRRRQMQYAGTNNFRHDVYKWKFVLHSFKSFKSSIRVLHLYQWKFILHYFKSFKSSTWALPALESIKTHGNFR